MRYSYIVKDSSTFKKVLKQVFFYSAIILSVTSYLLTFFFCVFEQYLLLLIPFFFLLTSLGLVLYNKFSPREVWYDYSDGVLVVSWNVLWKNYDYSIKLSEVEYLMKISEKIVYKPKDLVFTYNFSRIIMIKPLIENNSALNYVVKMCDGTMCVLSLDKNMLTIIRTICNKEGKK